MKSVPPPPPDIKGRNKTDLQKRKQIIRSLAVGLAVTAWQKPIVNSVLLPAHAQTSADPANPSGQAGEAGQVGQTEQGQTNQEQTAVPQQNQQNQQRNPGEPYHDRLEPLPRGDTLTVIYENATDCGTIQIVRYELADLYHAPGQVEKDYWIKITGIQTPIRQYSHTNEKKAPLSFRLINNFSGDVFSLDTSIDTASGNRNAQPARDSGMFTAFFLNAPTNPVTLNENPNATFRPLNKRDVTELRRITTLICEGTR